MIANRSRTHAYDLPRESLERVLEIHAELVESLEWDHSGLSIDRAQQQLALRQTVASLCRRRLHDSKRSIYRPMLKRSWPRPSGWDRSSL